MQGSGAPGRSTLPRSASWLGSSATEDAEWDAFVDRHPSGVVYQSSAWRRVLEQAFRHISGRVLVIRDGLSGRIVGGIPIYAVHSWLLGNRLVSIPFASVCEILVDSTVDFELMMPHLLEASRSAEAARIEIRARPGGGIVGVPLFARTRLFKHHLLGITGSEDDLFRRFSKTSVCQRIRKAQKAGIVVERADERDLGACQTILARTRRRLSLPPMPRSFFDAMRRWLWPDRMKVFFALQNGEPIACHLVLTGGDLWISDHSGCLDGTPRGVNQLLYWETIRHARAAGAKAFSFGRTAVSNAGLLDYKRRWGTVEEDIVSFSSRAGLAAPMHAAEETVPYRLIQHVVRRTPMAVGEMIGRFCYRHLG